ncbi:MAG: hypothetical protein PHP04_05120 [Bacteroidales bacterium]|nr:hypothetical protein [Bacteroidales bacterium]HNW73104.1 hypothetical protein [Bacteroidales bacterium]HPS50293.1 hypothetical protein [Bacteroidales bacterium]
MKKNYLLLCLATIAFLGNITAQPDMKETMSIIKSSLVQSKVNMRQYSWIETTKTWIKDELKSTKQNQCYYSVDGKLIKVATGGTVQPAPSGGIKGKIIANKKEDMQEYVTRAMNKINDYLPPDGDKIQRIYESGKVAIQILEPGKKFKLDFPNYMQNGDMLSISVDMAAKKLLALSVATWLDTPSDKVGLNVKYNSLPDGTQYEAGTVLTADAKNLKLEIEESGFRKGNGQ